MISWVKHASKYVLSVSVLALIGSLNPAFGLQVGENIVNEQNFQIKEADKYDYWLASILEGTVLMFEYTTDTDIRFAIMPYEAFLIFAEKTSDRLAQQASFENEVRGLSLKYYEVNKPGSKNESLTIPASGKYAFVILRPSNSISKLKVYVSKVPEQPLESRIAELEKITTNYGVQITNLISNISNIQNSNIQSTLTQTTLNQVTNEIDTIHNNIKQIGNQLTEIQGDYIGQITGQVNTLNARIDSSITFSLGLFSLTGLSLIIWKRKSVAVTIKKKFRRGKRAKQGEPS